MGFDILEEPGLAYLEESVYLAEEQQIVVVRVEILVVAC